MHEGRQGVGTGAPGSGAGQCAPGAACLVAGGHSGARSVPPPALRPLFCPPAVAGGALSPLADGHERRLWQPHLLLSPAPLLCQRPLCRPRRPRPAGHLSPARQRHPGAAALRRVRLSVAARHHTPGPGPGGQPALPDPALSPGHGSLCPLRPGGVLGPRLGAADPAWPGSRPSRPAPGPAPADPGAGAAGLLPPAQPAADDGSGQRARPLVRLAIPHLGTPAG